MKAPTPWRRMLYAKLEGRALQGKVLDLGGSRKSGYHELFTGSKDITVVNMDHEYGFDLQFDLELLFPLEDDSYQTILCINTLEHIFNYQSVLSESARVLSHGGQLVVAVPFLMNIHPSPHDFWRYSSESLERMVEQAGFTSTHIQTVGTGPCTASLQLLYPFLKFSILRNIAFVFAICFDRLLRIFAKNVIERYPLGYLVIATKK